MKIKSCTIIKQLIFTLANDVRQNLSIAFRKRYLKAISIIDCFEIQIEKPSNTSHQALTWSQYKSCNTYKYLVSIASDGLINFISDSYGGPQTQLYLKTADSWQISRGKYCISWQGFQKYFPFTGTTWLHTLKAP